MSKRSTLVRPVWRSCPALVLLLGLAVAALAPLALAQPTLPTTVYLPIVFGAPTPPPTPSVAVSLSTDRSTVDTQNDPWFDLLVTVSNTGAVVADQIAVTITYDANRAEVVTWPSNTTAIADGSLSLLIPGPLAPATQTTVQLEFRAASDDFAGAHLSFGASYTLEGGPTQQSNSVTVVAQGPLPTPPGSFSCNVTAPYSPLGVQPASGVAPVGTPFLFAAFGSICGATFAPEEQVSFWVNRPDGSVRPIDQVVADDAGDVQQSLQTGGYAGGCYSMVASNASQSTTLVGAFILDDPSQPGACAGQLAASGPQRPAGGMHPTTSGAQATGTGGVRGRVRGDDGSPLADVLVLVRDGATGRALGSALSGPDGSYFIPLGLPSGVQQVTFYASRSRNAASARYADATAPVTITEPTSALLDGVVARGGTISGRVLAGESGAGLAAVRVLVYDANATAVLAAATTDERGSYTTPALAPGSYLLRFAPHLSPAAATRAYQSSFAQRPVTLNAAAPLMSADASLSRCPSCGELRGTVRAADSGAGLPGVFVLIQSAADGRLAALARTGPDGAYLALVPSGSYRVALFSDTGPAPTRRYLDGPLDGPPATVVAPASVPLPAATLAPGGQFAGRVTAAGSGAPLAGAVVLVQSAAGETLATTITKGDGTYLTPALPNGSYLLLVRPAQGAKNLPYGAATTAGVITGPTLYGGLDLTLPPASE